MNERWAFFRFLLVGPLTFIALGAFALYFGVRNAGYFQKRLVPMIAFKMLIGKKKP